MPALSRPELEPIIILWLCLVGACVGSFLNVAIFRVPRKCLSVFKPTWSFCPNCHHAIAWYENIPVLSWVLLRARCSSCKLPIAWRYPSVELFTTIVFGWLAWHYLPGHLDQGSRWGLFVVHATVSAAFITIAMIDFDHRIIPDVIDIPGMLLAPVCVFAVPALLGPHLPDLAGWGATAGLWLEGAFGWWGIDGALAPARWLAALPQSDPSLYPHLAGLAGSLLGIVVGAGLIFGIAQVFRRLVGVEAMGFGDVKLMAFIGGLTGWQGVLVTLLLACLAGSIGGIFAMAWSGRTRLVAADLRRERTPIAAAAFWLCGVQATDDLPDDAPLDRRWGSWLAARFATGDPYVPFGPFLVLGGWIAAVFPLLVPKLLAA